MAVRGTFDLNDRPAVDAMRRLRREGAETDATMRRLGDAVDNTFTTKNVEQARRYEGALRDVDRTARVTLGSVRREWSKTERQTVKSVATSEAAVDRLQVRLDRLGNTRVSPEVDLDGVTAAIGQVELLERRLRSLGRQTARPNVGMPLPTGGAGGAGRVPTTGHGGFGGGLKIPFAGSVPYPLVAGALGAASPLTGGALALAGSAGAAALGAGTIGLGAAGVGSAALGLSVPIGYAAIKEIKASSDALKKYREEVLKTGKDSEASRQALHRYNLTLQGAPQGTRQFLRARTLLGEEFTSATRPARSSFTRIGTRGLNVGRQLTPTVAPLANEFFGEAQTQAGQFGDFLAGPSSRAFITAMGNEATRSLEPTEHVVENITALFMNASRAARPFFREGLSFLDRWTGGWRKSSQDIRGMRTTMGGWVNNLKSWGRLIGATGRLGGDLLSAGTGSGQSMVVDLTKQLNEWDRWIERNPRKVKAFFDESVETVEKISSGIGNIVQSLWRIGQLLTPLLGNAAELVTLLGNAGLLTPAGLPLLLAGGAGVRNATRGLGNRLRGTPAAGAGVGAPLIIGGGGAAAAGGAATARFFDRGTYDLARSFGRGRIASTVAGVGASGTAERAAMFGRGFIGRLGPFLALSAGLGAASYQGNAEERLQAGLSGASFGLIKAPESPAEKQDQGGRYAQMVAEYQAKRFGGDKRGLRRQLLGLRRKIHSLLTEETPEGGITGFLTQDIIGGGGNTEISDEAKSEAKALRARRREIAAEELPRAEFGDIMGAFNVRARHGDPRKAAEVAAGAIERRIHHLRGATAKEFGQMSLSWVHELSAAEPKLRPTYNHMAEQIENRLNRMGQNVAVIHGRIVDVSRKSWAEVANAIDSETQRALSSANKNLTALEQRAERILLNMGYNHTQAQSLMHEAQTGRPTKAGSEANAEAHRHGMPGVSLNNLGPQGRHAGGGRLPMLANGSMQDTIYLGNNQWGAAGELMVNRHTERRVDRLLRLAGTSLGREVGREQRPHSAMFRPQFPENAAFGRRFATGGISAAGRLATSMGLSVSGGPGYGGIPSSGHVSDSLHYSGLAYDVSGSPSLMRRFFFTALRDFRGSINELFYDPIGWYIDQGHKVAGAIGGHSDHVHIGFFPSGAHWAKGAAAFRPGAGALAGRGRPNIHLQGPRSGLGGIPGAAADQASRTMAAGLSKRLNQLIGARGGAGAGGLAAPGGSRSAVERQIAQELFRHGANRVGAAGIIGNAWRESRMDPGAEGTGGGGLWGFTSGAISLANLKRAGGRSWESPVFQTRFMLQHGGQGLIPSLNRAGSPEAAARIFMEQWERPGIPALSDREAGARVAFSQGYGRGGRFAGWFRDGFTGTVNKPTLFGAGEAGTEDVTITPRPRRKRGGHRRENFRIEVNVNMGGVTMSSSVDARQIGQEVGDSVAQRIRVALEESDGVKDSELVG